MSARIGVRAHSRRSPGSQPRTGFDWRTETLILQKRSRLGLAEAQGDTEGAERLRREVDALEAKYKRKRLALADRQGDAEGAERLRRELAELERKGSR